MITVAFVATIGAMVLISQGVQQVIEQQNIRSSLDEVYQETLTLEAQVLRMLYVTEDIAESKQAYLDTLDQVDQMLSEIGDQEGLDTLPAVVVDNMRSLPRVWDPSVTKLREATSRHDALQLDGTSLGEMSLVDALELVSEEGVPSDVSIEEEQLQEELEWSRYEIEGALDKLDLFIRNSLQGLQNIVALSTGDVIRRTITTSAVGAGSLLLLMLAILIPAAIWQNRSKRQALHRSAEVQGLLDAADEGFFSFNSNLIINPEVSATCNTIFGQEIAGQDASEILYTDEEDREYFRTGMNLVFSGRALPEVIFDTMDSTLSIGDRDVEIVLKQIASDQIMVSARDVTERERLRRAVQTESIEREIILKAVTAKSHFMALVAEADKAITDLRSYAVQNEEAISADELMREVHTFKSNAAFLRMESLANAAHQVETAVQDADLMDDTESLGPIIEQFVEELEKVYAIITKALGESWLKGREVYEVPRHILYELDSYIRERYYDDSKMLEMVEQIQQVSLRTLFEDMQEYAPILATARGKRVAVDIEMNEIWVSEKTYQALSDMLHHTIRNMVDHGIELPGNRLKKDKSGVGQITLRARQEGTSITVEIADDGQGIDVDRVRQRAIQQGLITDNTTLTAHEAHKLIFQDGFSTSDSVTTTSGRGAGMAAVRSTLREIGGRVWLSSTHNVGTTFRFQVPKEERV